MNVLFAIQNKTFSRMKRRLQQADLDSSAVAGIAVAAVVVILCSSVALYYFIRYMRTRNRLINTYQQTDSNKLKTMNVNSPTTFIQDDIFKIEINPLPAIGRRSGSLTRSEDVSNSNLLLL